MLDQLFQSFAEDCFCATLSAVLREGMTIDDVAVRAADCVRSEGGLVG